SSRFVLMDEISGDGTPGFLDEIDEGVGLEVVDREEELARVFRLFVVDPARGAKEQPIADRARRALERIAPAVELLGRRDVPDDLHRRGIPDDGRAIPEIEQVGLGGADEGDVPVVELPGDEAVVGEAQRLSVADELALLVDRVARHRGARGVADEQRPIVCLDEGAAARVLAHLREVDFLEVERAQQAEVAVGADVVVDLVHDGVQGACAGTASALCRVVRVRAASYGERGHGSEKRCSQGGGDSLLSCFYVHPILRTDSSECGIPPLTSGRVARSSRSRWARAARSDRAPYWNARRASSCFRDDHGSELRGGLDEKGPAWALDSIEVEGRFV